MEKKHDFQKAEKALEKMYRRMISIAIRMEKREKSFQLTRRRRL